MNYNRDTEQQLNIIYSNIAMIIFFVNPHMKQILFFRLCNTSNLAIYTKLLGLATPSLLNNNS